MWQLILGSLSLSVVHALIPNHWLPIVTIAKAEKWKIGETIGSTAIIAFFHLLSSIIVGFLIGLAGIKIFEEYEQISRLIVMIILIVMGIAFFFYGDRHSHEHIDVSNKKSKIAIITSLSIGMFFSPCLELDAYYLQAANFGLKGLIVVSLVYLIVTISCIIGLVYLTYKGINKFKSDFIEKYASRITGVILVILGILGYFIEF